MALNFVWFLSILLPICTKGWLIYLSQPVMLHASINVGNNMLDRKNCNHFPCYFHIFQLKLKKRHIHRKRFIQM